MPKSSKSSKPQRPRSAYNFYMMEKRKEVAEKNPEMSSKDLMKEVSVLWKQVTEEEKKKYEDMAKQDRARVAEENKNAPPSDKKSKSKKKKESEDEDDDKDEDEDDDDDE